MSLIAVDKYMCVSFSVSLFRLGLYSVLLGVLLIFVIEIVEDVV